jgi:hypothetical protein
MDRLLRATPAGVGGENYPQDSITPAEHWVIDLEKAEYLEAYKLRLQFSDGAERVVDFEPFLSGSLNPLIRSYLDLDKFKQFSVEFGDLSWNDYDLCFPIADLYDGRI